MLTKKRRNLYYQILLWFSLVISLFVLFYLSPVLFKPENIIVDDFSQFWAAGKLNMSGGNPYSTGEITRTIQGVGGMVSNGDIVSIMLNPPWTLAFIMPFAFLDYPISRLIWLLLNVALVTASTKYLSDIYGEQERENKMAYLLVFFFSPALAVLQKGQFTPIILFGIVFALYIIKKQNNLWLAGIFLAFATLKPQLLYLFWIVLILWTIYSKRWQLLISTIFTVLILTVIAVAVNPNVMSHYIHSMGIYPFSEWATPTIGSLLRVIFGLEKYWLQFLPMVIASVLFILYWLRHKEAWNWIDSTPMIVAISMLTTAYSWTYDAILFLIPIVQAMILTNKDHSKRTRLIVYSSLFLISILNLLLHTRLNDFWFFWLSPSVFIWYLVTVKVTGTSYKVLSSYD